VSQSDRRARFEAMFGATYDRVLATHFGGRTRRMPKMSCRKPLPLHGDGSITFRQTRFLGCTPSQDEPWRTPDGRCADGPNWRRGSPQRIASHPSWSWIRASSSRMPP
jgi:hypothetical protein